MQNTKQKITLLPLTHKGTLWIGIQFMPQPVLQQAVKKIKHVKWSNTNKCWYIPFTRACYNELLKNIDAFAEIDNSALKQYKTANTNTPVNPTINVQALSQPAFSNSIKPAAYINPVNRHVLPQMQQMLILKAYSHSTIKTYLNEMSQFLSTIKDKPAADFSVLRLKDYLQYCYQTLQLSENTLHSRINAMKFYYEQVLGKEKFFWEIPRPKKHLILPKVLGEEELRRLFNAANNLKHKAILFTAYSAGLRVSEVINLRMQDIDRERRQLFVYCSKGKKDRYVSLSPLLLEVLENYYKLCSPRPCNYLFEGTEAGKPYSIRSAQEIFHNAKLKAGISKTISFHGLRHSFATHMLEKGVDVKYIKEILGHFNIKTTERYLHVRRETLINIESPLDSLYRRI